MLESFTFWLVVLAVLTAYLCASVWLRHRAVVRAQKARLREIEREYPARAFDTSALAPRIRRVRQDYSASSHRSSSRFHHHAEMVAAARRLVTSLAYFRRARHEHELQKHDS